MTLKAGRPVATLLHAGGLTVNCNGLSCIQMSANGSGSLQRQYSRCWLTVPLLCCLAHLKGFLTSRPPCFQSAGGGHRPLIGPPLAACGVTAIVQQRRLPPRLVLRSCNWAPSCFVKAPCRISALKVSWKMLHYLHPFGRQPWFLQFRSNPSLPPLPSAASLPPELPDLPQAQDLLVVRFSLTP